MSINKFLSDTLNLVELIAVQPVASCGSVHDVETDTQLEVVQA